MNWDVAVRISLLYSETAEPVPSSSPPVSVPSGGRSSTVWGLGSARLSQPAYGGIFLPVALLSIPVPYH